MSSERIDHAAQAEVIRKKIRPDEMADADTPNWLALAQVHATLAIAEQQRIANLLALSQWRVESGDGPELFTTSESAMKLRIEAWTALGLEATE